MYAAMFIGTYFWFGKMDQMNNFDYTLSHDNLVFALKLCFLLVVLCIILDKALIDGSMESHISFV